jgi:hypothetical protein
LLSGSDRLLREAAAVFLKDSGETAEPAIIGALRDGNHLARPLAANLLAKFQSTETITALGVAFSDTESAVRLQAAYALRASAKSAVPAVLAIDDDETVDVDLRIHAAYTLARIPDRRALATLQRLRTSQAEAAKSPATEVFLQRLDFAIKAALNAP